MDEMLPLQQSRLPVQPEHAGRTACMTVLMAEKISAEGVLHGSGRAGAMQSADSEAYRQTG